MSTKTINIEDQANTLAIQLTEAEALAASRQTELAHITTALNAITRAWNTGDDTHTAADLTHAQAEHARLEALADAATVKVERLRNSQINLDLAVAHAMAPVIKKITKYRVPVTVRAGRPPQNTDGHPIPQIVLTQAAPPTNRDGSLSGEIELTYLRDDLMSPFPLRDLEDFAQAHQTGLEVRTQRIGNGSGPSGATMDWAKIGIGWAFPETPVITDDPTAATVKNWARDLGYALAYTVKAIEEPVHYLGEPVDRSTSSVLTSSLTSTTVTKGGRTTKVTADLLISPRRNDYSPELLMKDVLDAIAGSAARGLGRCTEAQTRIGLYSGLAFGNSTNRRVVYVTATYVSATK